MLGEMKVEKLMILCPNRFWWWCEGKVKGREGKLRRVPVISREFRGPSAFVKG